MLPKAANMELLETRNITIAGLAFDVNFAPKVLRHIKQAMA